MDTNASSAVALAATFLSRGLAQNAVDLLKRALADEPDNATAHALLGHALVAQRRTHAGLFEARLSVELEPENPVCHGALASAYVARRRLDRAREHAEKAIELAPDRADAQVQLAEIELLADRPKQALEAAERARALQPDDPDVLASFGRCQLANGDERGAEQSAREALEAFPEHADALVLMGRVLLHRGDTQGAREHAIWVLHTSPDHQGAVSLLIGAKMRESIFLGLWWRYASWMSLQPTKGMAILVGAYMLQRVVSTWAGLEQHQMTQQWVSLAWLGICIYSWVSPAIYARALAKELDKVKLREDF